MGQENYVISYLTEKERANFGDIYSLYEDPTGIIWMGIYGKGLAYYDGERVKRFPLPNEQNFANRDVIFEGFEEYIYFNYGNSVHVFDPIAQNIPKIIKLTETQNKQGQLSSITVTRKGDDIYTWGTLRINSKTAHPEYHLLISKNHGKFTQLTNKPIRTQGSVLIKRCGNQVFIKAENGFEMWAADGKTTSLEFTQVPMEIITPFNVTIEENKTIWVAGNCQEFKMNGNNRYLYACDIWKKSPNTNQFIQIKADAEGRNVLSNVNSFLRKLCIINGKHFSIVAHNDRLEKTDQPINIIQNDNISLILPHTTLQTTSGIIWWASKDGLFKLTPQPPAFKLLPALSMRAFVEDENGHIYGNLDLYTKYTKGSSIMKYDPETNKTTTVLNVPYGGGFWYHANAHKGNVHAFSGLLNFEKGYTKVFEDVYKDFSDRPLLSLITKKGTLWKAHWGIPYIGIYDLDDGKRIKKVRIEALQAASVSLNDWYQRPSDNTIWLGSYGVGIFIFNEDGTLLHHLNRTDESIVPLVNNVVSSFYEDSQGRMWIGHGAGLSRIDADFSNITHYTIDAFNPESRLVYGILPEDDDHFLWLSTSKGIFRFDTNTEKFMDFPLHPNIMNYEYNRTSYLKSSKGQFFFGNSRSDHPTISFYPDEVLSYYKKVTSKKSQIILTSFSQYDGKNEAVINHQKGLQSIDSIILQPGDRFFELSFAATDFRSPENNHYTFYLENYDDDWYPIARNNNKVRYENLPPGTYMLKLRGALVPKSVSENERTITVIVQPFWYQTLWAKMVLTVLILSIAFLILQFKLRQQRTKQESVRLLELDNIKTKLYTNITHEFRTPLTVIMGMNENISGHPNERSLIQRNAENLLGLINQLLDLSKLDAGMVTLETTRGDVIVYLQYLTESFYSMASQKKVSLRFESALESLEMEYDETKLQHVLYNLLSNAIKFTQSGGKINVSVSIEAQKNDSNLKIEIKDTGEGIAPDDLPHIFERFYQGGSKTTVDKGFQSYSGTGIGLSLTKDLVEVMQGKIDVQSKLGWGTSFTVVVPIKNAQATTSSAPISSENNLKLGLEETEVITEQPEEEKPMLLLIEDSAGIVSYIRSIVEKTYDVHVAINGEEGVDKAIVLIPDLIISDVMMPKKNGFEVCDILKKDERTSHIPIIMLTAKADISSKIEGLETGADAYMTKPFEKNELMIRIKKLLELRKKLQEYYGDGKIDTQNSQVSQPVEHAFVAKIQSYIELHFQDSELSVTTISEALNLSHSQLYRKLKAITGKTLTQFIRSVRLQKAVHLIQTTDLTISEIAYEVGYNDPNYFTRTFKKEFKKVPGDLRNTTTS